MVSMWDNKNENYNPNKTRQVEYREIFVQKTNEYNTMAYLILALMVQSIPLVRSIIISLGNAMSLESDVSSIW